MPSKTLIAISFAGFIVAIAAPSASYAAGGAEVRLRYNHTDLATVEQTRQLYGKIEARAASSCALTSIGRLKRPDVEALCAAQVTEDIVAKISNDRLNRVHAQAINGANFAVRN